ncbi:MAG: 50S ribosomal protein L24, partial [Candidatus Marsarchaeota archaeon]|nr:50S ribosomal protein L24 [Candidatus Marsarchaeota archaeon]
MIKSGKPRKQRKFRYNAPLHQLQHMAHAHLSKDLKQKLKVSMRSIQISKGDTVKIVTGSKKGTSGKVTRVDLRKGKLFIESYNRKDAKGKEKPISINISNVYITDLNLSDKKRA